jgi:hypothetical protein
MAILATKAVLIDCMPLRVVVRIVCLVAALLCCVSTLLFQRGSFAVAGCPVITLGSLPQVNEDVANADVFRG